MKSSTTRPQRYQVSSPASLSHRPHVKPPRPASYFLSPSAKHYDADTTEPISCGLVTLDELLSWKRSEANPFNVAAVSLARREPPLASSPCRTLVSHDMMGGYLDDRYGGLNENVCFLEKSHPVDPAHTGTLNPSPFTAWCERECRDLYPSRQEVQHW